VLTPALRWYRGDRSLKNLEECLLNALTGYVAR